MGDPDSCFQSKLTRHQCAKCRKIAVPVHMPGAYVGYFCGACCPACKGKPTERPK